MSWGQQLLVGCSEIDKKHSHPRAVSPPHGEVTADSSLLFPALLLTGLWISTILVACESRPRTVDVLTSKLNWLGRGRLGDMYVLESNLQTANQNLHIRREIWKLRNLNKEYT